ncbi:MAG: hypothetical protein IJO34_08090 [Akkermansia sp.]|nr:hypothetical protein [Akkermansia sp.]
MSPCQCYPEMIYWRQMKYYAYQTLLVVPLAAALLVLGSKLPLTIPYVGDVLMVLPSIFCCAIHLWVQKARILSLGTLYTCIFLPLLSATLYCIYAHSQASGQSMIGMIYIVMWWLNFLTCALILSLTAMVRMACGRKR